LETRVENTPQKARRQNKPKTGAQMSLHKRGCTPQQRRGVRQETGSKTHQRRKRREKAKQSKEKKACRPPPNFVGSTKKTSKNERNGGTIVLGVGNSRPSKRAVSAWGKGKTDGKRGDQHEGKRPD